jgi:CheY-like chemotaxis protein
MRIESQPGNGTQVYFSGRFTALPGEEEEAPVTTGDADAAEAAAEAEAAKRVEFNRRREYEDEDDDLRGLRILAVDDSEVFIPLFPVVIRITNSFLSFLFLFLLFGGVQGVRTFIEEELKALGCHILCTGDGTHAIRQLRFAAANKTPYNLLLLDYHVRRVSCRVSRVACRVRVVCVSCHPP